MTSVTDAMNTALPESDSDEQAVAGAASTATINPEIVEASPPSLQGATGGADALSTLLPQLTTLVTALMSPMMEQMKESQEQNRRMFEDLRRVKNGYSESDGHKYKLTHPKDPFRGSNFTGDRAKWSEFDEDLKTYIGGINSAYVDLMEWAELQSDENLTMDDLQNVDEKYVEMSKQLYTKVVSFPEGEAKTMMTNEKPNGLLAWKRIAKFFDPCGKVSRIRLLGRVLNPGSVASLDKLNEFIQDWVKLKTRYEKAAKKIVGDESACSILVQMCPPDLKDYLERRAEEYDTYQNIMGVISAEIDRRHEDKNSKGSFIGQYTTISNGRGRQNSERVAIQNVEEKEKNLTP